MMAYVPLLVMALSVVFAAPSIDTSSKILMPQKRAALVLDRLLIALQKALHEESLNQRLNTDSDGPRTAPLRLSSYDTNDMTGLQRRGQGSGRGRVLRCYFNAITCF
ncbi:uncharacterized protein LOC123656723 [Melitaea cinxia]|uniref:uncharacterized protein LOC123656723 n=1 Tax=Melitaea cinxia TaxID=113334 RepID=UPI001E26EC25|nr:uncharacterized protein LOC123656723 [Melitaea cinxia]